MTRLIKKYKNRRLYDTETSQYITLEELQRYVVEGMQFKVEDSLTGNDITNSILLQIIVEMEAGSTQFLSSDILRQIIALANHPMQASLKQMMEQMFQAMEKPLQNNPYRQATETWNQQMQKMMQQWQSLFKG
ncbi:polyhydroxyalkanoate synthesis regulator DNA-binding domain-containing protein [Fluoribacter gormanii]|uniref:Polyhydroxyalkanoate synthesis repressor PhaR n=1 Tax=Fluoribacter gormanii TaxID=464 RepID=A0A377GG86_9GAMM|nr:polyhydroxyalkanoate synthesis regulator DNA-binding domain-containing protein [Fluoribacter gormanii]KTD01587.1 PHB/PHA accumulation regulator DNA-binding domain protein [Fluoribacter gormanii]MCW8444870.1 polyhydroxyalkanoate synthesis regulator DNA-binding domain-containing protein [Fluoribacter gormanii]MCW8470080.1 polyhydroxyalkanoate synthesis regulator DNA-binding domain-containing protein [Fluoribacter gormanii]SIR66873.1 polyhydroxyalkanoate synthesis repressor PhaR [Fluoribacter g